MSATVAVLTGAVALPRPPRVVGRITGTFRAIALPDAAPRLRAPDGWDPERATVRAPSPTVATDNPTVCPDCRSGARTVSWREGLGECTECLASVTLCEHGSPVSDRNPCLLARMLCQECGGERCVCGVEEIDDTAETLGLVGVR